MALATVTTKGQVTIPKEIRDSLNIKTGDKIEILITNEREATLRPVSKKVDDVFGKLHRINRQAVSIDEMNEAVKNRIKEKFQGGGSEPT